MNAQVTEDPAEKLYPGRCFYIPSGDSGSHLFVCVYGIKHVDGKDRVLTVSLCSVKGHRGEDTTCILPAGIHPFVKHESYVLYSDCREEFVSDMLKRLDIKQLVPHQDDASEDLLKRIREGFETSDRVKRNFRKNWGGG